MAMVGKSKGMVASRGSDDTSLALVLQQKEVQLVKSEIALHWLQSFLHLA